MHSEYVVGIDIGSSSCKIGLCSTDGRKTLLERVATPATVSDGLTSTREYNIDAWWNAVIYGIKNLLHKNNIKPSQILGVGLTGQIGTHLIVDERGDSLIPAISWQDGRAFEEAKWLADNYPGKELFELLGMHLPPSTAWPIPRLLWLKKNKPELFFSSFKILQVKDFIGFKLTGNFKTDILSLRGLVNPKTGTINNKVTSEILGISNLTDYIPEYDDATSVFGYVSDSSSRITGLPKGIPVVIGCGDFHASLIGTGIVNDSYSFNITGTSEHVGVLCNAADATTVNSVIGRYPSLIPNMDIIYGATSAGSGSIQWFIDKILNLDLKNREFKDVIQSILQKTKTSQGLIYLPYINGERAPIWNSNARGVFFGLSSSHDSSHCLRAVLEGVAFSLNDCLSHMRLSNYGDKPMKISGAAARDSDWNQIKADIFKLPIITTSCKESSFLGSSILCATGIGMYKSIEEACENMIEYADEYQPNKAMFSYYEKLFDVYKEVYNKTILEFDELATIRSLL